VAREESNCKLELGLMAYCVTEHILLPPGYKGIYLNCCTAGPQEQTLSPVALRGHKLKSLECNLSSLRIVLCLGRK